MYGFCFQLHSWCKCVKKMMLYTLNAFRWFFFSTATNFKDRLMLRENESEITKSRTGFQSRIVVFDINCILSAKSKFIYLYNVLPMYIATSISMNQNFERRTSVAKWNFVNLGAYHPPQSNSWLEFVWWYLCPNNSILMLMPPDFAKMCCQLLNLWSEKLPELLM